MDLASIIILNISPIIQVLVDELGDTSTLVRGLGTAKETAARDGAALAWTVVVVATWSASVVGILTLDGLDLVVVAVVVELALLVRAARGGSLLVGGVWCLFVGLGLGFCCGCLGCL